MESKEAPGFCFCYLVASELIAWKAMRVSYISYIEEGLMISWIHGIRGAFGIFECNANHVLFNSETGEGERQRLNTPG